RNLSKSSTLPPQRGDRSRLMHAHHFAVPGRRNPGPELPVEEIYSVEQALDVLAQWPADRQGRLYEKAFNACYGASLVVVPRGEACRALAAFCRVSGLMATDIMPPKSRKTRRLM